MNISLSYIQSEKKLTVGTRPPIRAIVASIYSALTMCHELLSVFSVFTDLIITRTLEEKYHSQIWLQRPWPSTAPKPVSHIHCEPGILSLTCLPVSLNLGQFSWDIPQPIKAKQQLTTSTGEVTPCWETWICAEVKPMPGSLTVPYKTWGLFLQFQSPTDLMWLGISYL